DLIVTGVQTCALPISVITGAVLSTTTVTGADVVALPAASRAIALREWLPSESVDVFSTNWYGLAVTSAPTFTPSSWNCTPPTPRSEERRVGKERRSRG